MKHASPKLTALVVLSVFFSAQFGCTKEQSKNARPSPAEQLSASDRAFGPHVLEMFDNEGRVVANGELRLPDRLPASGQSFVGTFQLTCVSDSFPTDRSRGGAYSGYVHGGGISLDLAPTVVDDNVVLDGFVREGRVSGKWYHSTDAGDAQNGEFRLTPPTDSVR